jgi:hypothetical protein
MLDKVLYHWPTPPALEHSKLDTSPSSLGFVLFFWRGWGRTGIWSQSFTLAKQAFCCLNYISSPFFLWLFWRWGVVSWTVCPDWWPQIVILLISASQVARITGVRHQHPVSPGSLNFHLVLPFLVRDIRKPLAFASLALNSGFTQRKVLPGSTKHKPEIIHLSEILWCGRDGLVKRQSKYQQKTPKQARCQCGSCL